MDAVLWGQQLGISKWTKQSFYSPGGGQCTRWDSRGTNEFAIRWATVSAVRPRSRVRATTTRRSVGSSRPRDPGTSRGVVGQLRGKPGLLLLQWCLRRHGIGPDTTAEQSGPHSSAVHMISVVPRGGNNLLLPFSSLHTYPVFSTIHTFMKSLLSFCPLMLCSHWIFSFPSMEFNFYQGAPPLRLACVRARARDNPVLRRACPTPARVGTAASDCGLRMQTHQITPARMPLKNACFPLSTSPRNADILVFKN